MHFILLKLLFQIQGNFLASHILLLDFILIVLASRNDNWSLVIHHWLTRWSLTQSVLYSFTSLTELSPADRDLDRARLRLSSIGDGGRVTRSQLVAKYESELESFGFIGFEDKDIWTPTPYCVKLNNGDRQLCLWQYFIWIKIVLRCGVWDGDGKRGI